MSPRTDEEVEYCFIRQKNIVDFDYLWTYWWLKMVYDKWTNSVIELCARRGKIRLSSHYNLHIICQPDLVGSYPTLATFSLLISIIKQLTIIRVIHQAKVHVHSWNNNFKNQNLTRMNIVNSRRDCCSCSWSKFVCYITDYFN